MRLILLPLLCLAAISAHADVKDDAMTITTFTTVNTAFLCGGTTGHCNYMITTSLCDEKILENGQKQKTCHVKKNVEFTIAAGEKKLVRNLPSDYQYCMKRDPKPDIDTCMNTYIAH